MVWKKKHSIIFSGVISTNAKLNETLDDKFNPKWIYDGNIDQMELTALTVEKILKIRGEMIKKT